MQMHAAAKTKEHMETVEDGILKVFAVMVWWGSGFILNGCSVAMQRMTAHETDLAVVFRIMGILSSGSVFIYTIWKMYRMWQNERNNDGE